MADFHIDHDVAHHVARLLRLVGHTAVIARDLGMADAEDYEHLLVAAQTNRILVTHNWKDFDLLHGAWLHWSQIWYVPATHASILVVEHQEPARLAREINFFVEMMEWVGEPLENRLFRWRGRTGWVERIRP